MNLADGCGRGNVLASSFWEAFGVATKEGGQTMNIKPEAVWFHEGS
jgi:hypothetical protein